MHAVEDIDWSIPIWEREKPVRYWDPGRRLIKTIRRYQRLQHSRNPINKLLRKLTVAEYGFWSMVTGAEIALTCQIGGGFLMPHPNGIVIHPDAVIGPNCMVFQQVTLAGAVTLGHHVDIGAGAKVLGPVDIANHVTIGANAVVKRDVVENDIVAGVPAQSIKHKTRRFKEHAKQYQLDLNTVHIGKR